MKKNYFIITFLFSTIMFGQTTFHNNTADGNWSTDGNWTSGVPTALTTSYIQLNSDVNLDVNTTINTLIRSASATVSGSGKITSTAPSGQALLANGSSSNFTFDADLEIDNGTTTPINLQVNGTNNQLILGPNSVLTLTTSAKAISASSTNNLVFQGVMNGGAQLLFSMNTVFDAGSDNSGFTGTLVFASGVDVVANTTGDGAFSSSSSKIQVNSTGASLTLAGANSCDGDITVGQANEFSLNINANQESLGAVNVGDGKLTINMDPVVTNLSFADSSAKEWGTATFEIVGYQSGVIRFGTSSDALTEQQLSQISADGVAAGEDLALDVDGYLILDSALSSNSLVLEDQIRISYPTLVDNQLNFSKPQKNIEIFDVAGNKILKISNDRGIDFVTTSQLPSGMYFIVFEGSKVEKLIKR